MEQVFKWRSKTDEPGRSEDGSSSAGNPVNLITNYVQIHAPELKIYVYNVGFEPKVNSLKAKKDLLAEFKPKLGSFYLFDEDQDQLYLPFKLDAESDGERDSLSFICKKRIDPKQPQHIHLTPSKYVTRSHQFSKRFCEILVKYIRSFHDQTPMKDIRMEPSIELRDFQIRIEKGMRIGLRVSNLGPMLFLEPNGFLWRTKSVLDELKSIPGGVPAPGQFMGKVVLATNSMRYYQVDDIIWDMTPRSLYDHNGRMITLAEYYQLEYDITIQDLDQPILTCRLKYSKFVPEPMNGRLVLLVPELCRFSGIRDDMRTNSFLTKQVHQHLKFSTKMRLWAVRTYLNSIIANKDCKALMDSWGFKIDEKLIETTGRVISGPTITLNAKAIRTFDVKKEKFRPSALFSNVKEEATEFFKPKTACFQPVTVKSWLILCAARDVGPAKRLRDSYEKAAADYGIEVSGGDLVVVDSEDSLRVDKFIKAMRSAYVAGQTQFVLVILPKGLHKTLYVAVKRVCLLELEIASQAVRIKNLVSVVFNGVVEKLALQINCKLGGGIWALHNPTDEAFMFVGIDTYHDPKRKGQSVFALVASLNPECTKYSTRTCTQAPGQETGNEIIPMFSRQLREYYEVCGRYPTKILVFRDGVSNAHLDLIRDFELYQFQVSVENIIPRPKITFVIVKKSSYDRFFRDGPIISHPIPGTIIDRTLTGCNYKDFMLISHLVSPNLMAMPSHCIILSNEDEGGDEFAQRMTFASTFMYYNWQKSIKIPAVCQYAHKAASFVARILKQDPAPKMSNTLYYL